MVKEITHAFRRRDLAGLWLGGGVRGATTRSEAEPCIYVDAKLSDRAGAGGAHGIGVIPYFSLAKGFLTGKYRTEADLTKRVRGQGVKAYLNERGFRILAALNQIAKDKRSTPARVALA